MWERIKKIGASLLGSNPWPRVLGGIVILGEAAKMGRDALDTGAIPTTWNDWMLFWLGIGVALSKQVNKTHATVAQPMAKTAPAGPRPAT